MSLWNKKNHAVDVEQMMNHHFDREIFDRVHHFSEMLRTARFMISEIESADRRNPQRHKNFEDIKLPELKNSILNLIHLLDHGHIDFFLMDDILGGKGQKLVIAKNPFAGNIQERLFMGTNYFRIPMVPKFTRPAEKNKAAYDYITHQLIIRESELREILSGRIEKTALRNSDIQKAISGQGTGLDDIYMETQTKPSVAPVHFVPAHQTQSSRPSLR